MGFAFNVSTHVATGTIGVDDLALDAVAVKIAAVMCAAVRLKCEGCGGCCRLECCCLCCSFGL